MAYVSDLNQMTEIDGFLGNPDGDSTGPCYYCDTFTITPLSDYGDYEGYLTMSMFNGGKNSQDCASSGEGCTIAEAKLAYDCNTKTLCAAAYLTNNYLLGPNYYKSFVSTNDADSYVDFGSKKLKESDENTVKFEYIYDPAITIDGLETSEKPPLGWEGCWENVDESDVALIDRVHFNLVAGNTVSTGQGGSPKICVVATCSSGGDPCLNKSEGEICTNADNVESCCSALGNCLESPTSETCPILCTSLCTGEESDCKEWTCNDADQCVEVGRTGIPNIFDGHTCGGANPSVCTEHQCVDGVCVTIPIDSDNNCDGVCCNGSCTVEPCEPASCPVPCDWNFSTNSPTTDLPTEPIVTDCKGTPPAEHISVVATDCQDNVVAMTISTALSPSPAEGVCQSYVRTYTTEEFACNSQLGIFEVTYNYVDTTLPHVSAPSDETQECGSDSEPPIPTDRATADDNCGKEGLSNPLYTSSGPEGDSYCGSGKQYTLTWETKDACGNIGTASQFVNVLDTTPPTIVLPKNLTLECGVGDSYDTYGNPNNMGTAGASDMCTSEVVAEPIEFSVSGTDFCNDGKTTAIKWSATDDCNNQATAIQYYTVKDTTPPEFTMETVPASVSFQCEDPCVNDGLHPTCTGAAPVAEDACKGTIEVNYEDCAVAHPDLPGVQVIRTFSASDTCNEPAFVSQTISVIDECSGRISNAFSGLDILVDVSITNTGSGISITVTESDAIMIGDLRAVFFQLVEPEGFVGDDFSSYVEGLTFVGTDVGNSICNINGVTKVANDALMRGGGNDMPTYTCGVELGDSGIGRNKKDIQTSTFTVHGPSSDDNTNKFTTDFLGEDPYFGIRLTSVGVVGSGREESSKVYGQVTCCRFPEDTNCGDPPTTSPPPTPSPPPTTGPPNDCPEWDCVALCVDGEHVLEGQDCPTPTRNRRRGLGSSWMEV